MILIGYRYGRKEHHNVLLTHLERFCRSVPRETPNEQLEFSVNHDVCEVKIAVSKVLKDGRERGS